MSSIYAVCAASAGEHKAHCHDAPPRAQHKELYLPRAQLAALNPEQQALIDFLVLLHSDGFVGLGSSTFSVYLRCGFCAIHFLARVPRSGVVYCSSHMTCMLCPRPSCTHPLAREYRVLLGHPRAADAFVDTANIGTDSLFEKTTHFAPLDA